MSDATRKTAVDIVHRLLGIWTVRPEQYRDYIATVEQAMDTHAAEQTAALRAENARLRTTLTWALDTLDGYEIPEAAHTAARALLAAP